MLFVTFQQIVNECFVILRIYVAQETGPEHIFECYTTTQLKWAKGRVEVQIFYVGDDKNTFFFILFALQLGVDIDVCLQSVLKGTLQY